MVGMYLPSYYMVRMYLPGDWTIPSHWFINRIAGSLLCHSMVGMYLPGDWTIPSYCFINRIAGTLLCYSVMGMYVPIRLLDDRESTYQVQYGRDTGTYQTNSG